MSPEEILSNVRFYRDFPQPGVNFIDVLPLMQSREVFGAIVADLSRLVAAPTVAAPEARGFLFAAPLLTVPGTARSLIAFRKAGKLPAADGDLLGIDIEKEYGTDRLYFRRSDVERSADEDGEIRITVFDDILATGGTCEAMAGALTSLDINRGGRKLPVRIAQFVFLGELDGLGGRERLEPLAPVHSLLKI